MEEIYTSLVQRKEKHIYYTIRIIFTHIEQCRISMYVGAYVYVHYIL